MSNKEGNSREAYQQKSYQWPKQSGISQLRGHSHKAAQTHRISVRHVGVQLGSLTFRKGQLTDGKTTSNTAMFQQKSGQSNETTGSSVNVADTNGSVQLGSGNTVVSPIYNNCSIHHHHYHPHPLPYHPSLYSHNYTQLSEQRAEVLADSSYPGPVLPQHLKAADYNPYQRPQYVLPPPLHLPTTDANRCQRGGTSQTSNRMTDPTRNGDLDTKMSSHPGTEMPPEALSCNTVFQHQAAAQPTQTKFLKCKRGPDFTKQHDSGANRLKLGEARTHRCENKENMPETPSQSNTGPKVHVSLASGDVIQDSVRIIDSKGRAIQPGDVLLVGGYFAVYVGNQYIMLCEGWKTGRVVTVMLDLRQPFTKLNVISGECRVFPPRQRVERALSRQGTEFTEGDWWDFPVWVMTGMTGTQAERMGFIW